MVTQIEPVVEEEGRALRLRFALVNRTHLDRTVTLQGHCPGGFVTLHGLPQGFDPMHTCRAGACFEPEMTSVVTVPAYGKVTIGETRLHASGDACNPPWPTGARPLSISVQGHTGDSFVCHGETVVIERDASSALRVVPPGSRPAPMPQPTLRPTQPPRPTTPVTPPRDPDRVCPACGIGCPDGRPLTGIGPDGCPLCGCEKHTPTILR